MIGLLRRLDRWLLPPLASLAARMGGDRWRWRSLIAGGLVVAGVLLLVTVWSAGRAGGRAEPPAAQVGVADGESMAAYRERTSSALAELVGGEQIYALVTFGDYLSPARLTPVVGGVATSAVYVQVPSGGAYRLATHHIPRDVTTGMAALADQLGEEQMTTGCRCVYAAVVRAGPRVLAEVATMPQVAAVEPAPQVRRLDRATFQPPQPPAEPD